MSGSRDTESLTTTGWLGRIERLGNRLPDPVLIFLALIGLLVLISALAQALNWGAVHPSSGEQILAQSLLSETNVARLLVEMPSTLTSFPPLGLVLVVMLGAAVAERSGLFSALLGRSMARLSRRWLTPSIFIIGLLSHHASDAAYIVLIPLAALAFAAAGRHPLAGIAVAYAGISGAFAGNLIPGQFDVLMLGITEPAARLIDPDFVMNPLGNWWFTLAIGVLFTPIAWYVTDRVVEPRLGPWRGPAGLAQSEHDPAQDEATALSPQQRRGIVQAGWAMLLVVSLFAALALVPGFSPLVDQQAQGPQRYTAFYRSLVGGFMLLFLASGWAYGAAVGTVRSHRDIVAFMAEGMRSMAPYIVIAFFAAHFVVMFKWSNLGPVLAINGAAWLSELALPRPLLLVALLTMSAVFDLVIGSASAKWSAMAPITVPMLMLLGISPEMTTAAYRMGDSIFNIVTPLASNFPLVLVLCQRWLKDFGIGSVIAMMLPYSLCFGVAGLLLVAAWVALGIPVGPGAPMDYLLSTGR